MTITEIILAASRTFLCVSCFTNYIATQGKNFVDSKNTLNPAPSIPVRAVFLNYSYFLWLCGFHSVAFYIQLFSIVITTLREMKAGLSASPLFVWILTYTLISAFFLFLLVSLDGCCLLLWHSPDFPFKFLYMVIVYRTRYIQDIKCYNLKSDGTEIENCNGIANVQRNCINYVKLKISSG